MARPWRPRDATRLQRCRVFDVDRVRFEPPAGGEPADFYRIAAPDWINVIPLTDDDHVVLLKQYRFGIEEITLEIPGGMCDPGELPEDAARRELSEETGFAAGRLEPLGWVHPNPALQSNRCYSYLARELAPVEVRATDPHEEFEQVVEPLARIPELISRGVITHALVVAAFGLYGVGAR